VRGVLIDAGPLVALIDRGDEQHDRCVEALREIRDPLITVWPAFTEAMYLLGPSWQAQAALWEMVASETVELRTLDHDDVSRMAELMRKHHDLPMDLADAALVRVAERDRIRQVFTLDQRDFSVYRPAGLGRLSLLPARD
jgi:predicted nucleic acid-binding protein